MANEYFAVILEVSPRLINVGFAGEAVPSVSLRPDLPIWKRYQPAYKETYPRHFGLQSHSISQEQKEEILELLKKDDLSRSSLNAYQEAHRGGNFTFWEQDNYRAVSRLLKQVVTKQLMVSPRHVKIMVLDNDSSALERFQLSSALLGPFGCAASVYFIPRAPCISMAASVEEALVVDIGWLECRLSALSELRVVKQRGSIDYSEETMTYGKSESQEKLENSGLAALVGGFVGELAVDVRPQVLQNLVFCGASLELQRDLVKQVQGLFPKLRVSGKYCLGAWAGGSIYCSTSLLKHDMNALRHREVTMEKLRSGAWKDVLLAS